jgi:hypothetical protein
MLQYLGLGIEPSQLTHPWAFALAGSFGDEANHLAFGDLSFVAKRQP